MNSDCKERRENDAFSWEKDVFYKGRFIVRYPSEPVVSFQYSIKKTLSPSYRPRILDIGCGTGRNSWFAAREGFDVAGLDLSPSAVEYARARLAGEGLEGDLRVGDMASLDWQDQSFDCAIDCFSLQHNRRSIIERALDEIARVLKPGGKFISEMVSIEHGARAFGQDLGDGAFDHFSRGYSAGLGTTFFASRADIERLYGSRFKMESLAYVSCKDCLGDGGIISAYFDVTCSKR